jgi:hypothetical protein
MEPEVGFEPTSNGHLPSTEFINLRSHLGVPAKTVH